MKNTTFTRRVILIILFMDMFLLVMPIVAPKSWAWSNGGYSADPANPDYGTHDWMAEHALDWLPAEEKQYIVDNLAVYLYGTELPDNGGAPDGIGDTILHHIYYNSAQVMTDDAAAVRASTEYNDSLNFLITGDLAGAAKNAGIMSHYIVDMAVFGHVMGAATDWGAETHHSDYEDYVNDRTSSYNAEFNTYLSFDGALNTISAYEAAKNLAYDTTFDVNGDLNCTWMDQNYDWNNPTFKNRAGESLNLAVNYLADVLHTLYLQSNIPNEHYISVPYHAQTTGYYCGPAALEMVFDYYGPDIPQIEIADVARTAPVDGTFTGDMVRAVHFSNLSTSVGGEMPGSITGYTARQLGYAAFDHHSTTMDELKFLIAADYPIIVQTTWHFRVAVGYNNTHITFQDSYWGSMYNMTYAQFDEDWDYSGHWALLVTPWRIQLSTPASPEAGSLFDVAATITYPTFPPFSTSQYPASKSNATLTLPPGLSLAPEETARKIIDTGNLTAGQSATVQWTVSANTPGNHAISVEAEGKIKGSVPGIPTDPAPYSYVDRIGALNQTSINVIQEMTPPVTTDNYDDLWHTTDITITLTATDTFSGVAETYYKINDGPTKTVSADGQPIIATESATNTLEYWSKDNADNEENHHILTGIKLDTTPPMISITDPDPDSEIKSSAVTIKWTSSDETSGINHYEIRLDDGSWSNVLTDKTYTLTNLTEGTHKIDVKATDNAGNERQGTVTFVVNTSPLLGPGYIEEVAITIILIAAATLGTAFYLIKKRRKS